MTPRVIIAHGFGTSAEIAQSEQTNNLRSALESAGYKVEYIQGPYKLTIDDFAYPLVRDISKHDLYAWWKIYNSEPSRSQAEQLVKALNSDTENPVVGFIGFSQGGSLTTLIAANHWIPSLKFAIAYGGFLYPRKDKPELENYDGKIDIPFLTWFGEVDDIVLPEQSLKVAEEQVEQGKSTVLKHAGGHIFADDESNVAKTIEWIKSVV